MILSNVGSQKTFRTLMSQNLSKLMFLIHR